MNIFLAKKVRNMSGKKSCVCQQFASSIDEREKVKSLDSMVFAVWPPGTGGWETQVLQALSYKGLWHWDALPQSQGWVPIRRWDKHRGWCGSVDWGQACKPKGCRFDSQPGHMPGLWARSPLWVQGRQPHIDVSLLLSPSLPRHLKKKKDETSNLHSKDTFVRICCLF